MKRYYLILFAFCLLLPAGCAVKPKQRQFSPRQAVQAESLMHSGQHQEAAQQYQILARSEPAQQDYYNLLAAEAYIKAGDGQTAERLANTINVSSLSAESRDRFYLLLAQISLSRGEAEKALNQLNTISAYRLEPKNKIIFYQSLAFAYSLTGRLLQSAHARIQLTPLLENSQQRQENNRVIVNTLNLLSPQTLMLKQPPAPDVLGGWMALTRLLKTRQLNQNQAEFQASLNEWKRLFPQHPANEGFLQTLAERNISNNFREASAIALFLPESGRYAQAAQVIKEGFKVAYQQAIQQPALRFYDSHSADIVSLYRQAIAEGAELIVGPLSKDKIETLALSTELSTPVLALNHIPNLAQDNLFQFGLSPIDEAIQLSIKARNDGHSKAVLMTSENRQGQRMAKLLTEYWESNGGTILETQGYNRKEHDFSKPIKVLLNLDESKYRYSRLKSLLGINIHFTERRRQDVDAIFLSASPGSARSIYPQLRFYHATRIPVYAPSQIYSGLSNRSKDLDLNSITFCDIPWLFADAYSGELSLSALEGVWEQFPKKYIRLFALGLDAFNIIDHLSQLDNIPYAGSTGLLSVNLENRITRQLVCAKFVNGYPVLQDFTPDEMPVNQETVYSEDVTAD